MKKFSLRVSGSRVGDSVRPASDIVVGDAVVELINRAPRAPFVAPVPKATTTIAIEDYATLEDYT